MSEFVTLVTGFVVEGHEAKWNVKSAFDRAHVVLCRAGGSDRLYLKPEEAEALAATLMTAAKVARGEE